MKRRVTWFALTLILAIAMIGSSVSVFAADNSATPKDGDTQNRMTNGGETPWIAEMTWDKCFELLGTKWPKKDSFDYTITKVSAWDNSHKDTTENGTNFTDKIGTDKDIMPAPSGGTTTDNINYTVNVPVSVGGTTTSGARTDGQAVTETKAGQAVSKFEFTRPGYYVYKVKEVKDNVGGVEYDEHTYYIAFYVANKTDKNAINGATQGGDEAGTTYGSKENLYVHTITAWRSQQTTGTNTQILEQIVIPQSVDPSFENSNTYYLKVKMETDADVTAANTDISNEDAVYYPSTKEEDHNTTVPGNKTAVTSVTKGNYYWVKVEQKKVDQAVARGEIGKTNRSKDKNEGEKVGPNKLTINFWNESNSKDITLEKKVTGTLGDLQKEFEFTVELTGLQKGNSYEVSGTPNTILANEKVEGLNPDGGKYYVTVAENAASTDKTFKVVLKAGQKIKISGLPTGATYKVTEAASDHAAKYEITSDNDATGDAAAVIKTASGDTNNAKRTSLSTDIERVDPTDGGITILYTNHRDIETETGIPGYVFPIVLAAMIALIGLAVMRRRNNVSSVNDFEF